MTTYGPTMRSLVGTWVALLVMTAVTVVIGSSSARAADLLVVGVLALAAIKVYLVGTVYMEVGEGPQLLSRLFIGYVGALFIGLSAVTLW